MALSGNYSLAISSLRHYADQGDASASASLAELLAFTGAWEECAQRAGALIMDPLSVYAGNVFDDMIRLLGCAGRATSSWNVIHDIAVSADAAIDETVCAKESDPIKRASLLPPMHRILENLAQYAQREGRPPHELIAIFGKSQQRSPEEYIENYEKALQYQISKKPDLLKNPEELNQRKIDLACTIYYADEALKLFTQGHLPSDFRGVLYIAKLLVGRGCKDEAWKIISEMIHQWHPVDRAQVAPVELLIDRDLSTLLNQARCHFVLARGGKFQNSSRHG